MGVMAQAICTMHVQWGDEQRKRRLKHMQHLGRILRQKGPEKQQRTGRSQKVGHSITSQLNLPRRTMRTSGKRTLETGVWSSRRSESCWTLQGWRRHATVNHRWRKHPRNKCLRMMWTVWSAAWWSRRKKRPILDARHHLHNNKNKNRTSSRKARGEVVGRNVGGGCVDRGGRANPYRRGG